MERHTRLSRAAVVLVAIALIAAIAAAVWFASPDAPYVPSEDSGAALGTAAPAEDGTVANQQTTVPSGYTGIYNETDFNNRVRGGNGKFILMSDITLTTLETSRSFAGILDGNGHTITIAAPNVAEGEGDSGGLFATLTTGNAEIKNLKIEVNQFMISTNQTKGSVGIIAAWVSSNVTIDNVYIELKYSPDTMRIGNGGNGKSNAYLFARQELGKDASLWLGGVLAKVEGEGNTVTIKNTTVNNQTTGSYGFSTNVWTVGGWGLNHTDSFTQIGGFVAAVVKGTLNITNCKYEGEGKMTVTAESTDSSRYNAARIGGAVGQVEGGTLKVNGFIFESRGTRDSLFGTAGSNNTNYSDESGRGLIIGKGNPSTLTNLYINGETDPGHGFSNNDSATHDSKLIGDNTYWGGMLQYPSEFIDAEFDGSNVVFAVGKKEPTASDIVYQVKLRETATDQDYTGIDQSTFTVSDSEIADSIAQNSDEIGQAAWITLGTITRNNASYDYELTVSSRAAQSAYNVQNYDAVSSAGDSAYLGSKVYDGTPVATPTLDVGGTTVNAWTADNTTADVGTKTFSYNESALSGYAAATYNGGTYLVKGGTIYSPGTITVNGVGQTFALGKNFVYEITPAPVTVTPSAPTDLYAGNSMPELTATAVDSGGSPVEGSIEWDDPDATLISGKHNYAWTWTPRSSNYQTVKDSMELEAFDRKIESLTIKGDFKKEYIAYEPFNSTGVEVYANYSDGTQAKLDDNKYEFTVVNGDINKLIVANDTVTVSLKKGSGASTTITITVSKLAVDVPIANQGLVYNGAQQTGVAASEYYDLTGNTAEDAGDYVATATLTDTYNTRWNTADADDTTPKEIGWSIAQMTLDGTVLAPTDLTYDGNAKEATFNRTSGELFNGDAVTIEYSGDCVNVTDDGFTATAVLPSGDNYAWADDTAPSASFTVTPKPVVIGVTGDLSKTYDGQEVDPDELFTAPQGVGGGELALTVAVDGGKTILNAGSYTVTAVLADGQNNYTAQSAQATYEIAKVVLTGTLTFAGTATYDGTAKTATFILTSDNLVGQDRVGEVTYNDVDRINVTGQAIVASVAPPSDNYQWQDGVEPTASLTIVKATPGVTVELSDDMPGNLTVAATLDNAWLVRTDNTGVEGTLAWDKAGELLQQGKVEYGWTFVPTDSNNYNNVTGSLSITASEDTLQSITVKDGTYKKEYTAYEDFDPTGLVVIAHYASGTEVEVTSGFTFENDKALTDGQITVTLNGVSTTITVTVNKREIPLPAATEGLIFNGEEQNGIDQKWIEQYAEFVKVDGNLQRDAGDYRATVTLTKDTNYVTWKGGSTDAQTIDWSIAYVTIEVTVNAESKTVEYGTAYSWNPYDFFAVEVTNSDLFEVKLGVFNDGSITDISTANVGEYSEGIFASVTRKDGGALEEQDLASFKFSQDIKQLVMKVIVTAKTVEVALDENVDFAAYDGEKLSEEELFGMFKMEMNKEDLAFEVNGVPYDEAEIVNAGEYTVKVVSANHNYNLTGTTEGVYKIAKATLTVTASAESDGLDTSDDLYAVPLNVKGVGVKGEEVSGTGVWAPGQSLSEGTNKYKFVFTPDQEFAVNYEVCEGECEIANVAQATLTGVSVDVVATTEYVAFDAFDRSSIVVEALYGEDRKQVADYTLTFSSGAEDRLLAGTGITVTVTYTDGDVKQSTEFTIDVAKRAVAKPVVDTTVFDATGETITLPIAESEYYTIDGNTAIEPGRYVATVELNDPANTMWEDGSTDVVSIAWTISEPVTSDEVIADILAMEKVTWQNAEEFLDLEARYNALDKSEQTAEATAKLATLKAQYDALRNAAFDDIEAAHEVTAKSLGKALAAAAAGLSAAAIALAIAKRRSI